MEATEQRNMEQGNTELGEKEEEMTTKNTKQGTKQESVKQESTKQENAKQERTKQESTKSRLQTGAKKDYTSVITQLKKKKSQRDDSIVYVAVGGQRGFQVGKNLLGLNNYVRQLKNYAVFGDIAEVKKGIEQVEALKDEIWETMKGVIPRLGTYSPERWASLNNTKEEKLTLAQRRSAYVITPVDNSVAAITIAVKLLAERIMELQAGSNFDELSRVVEIFRDVNTRLEDIVSTNRPPSRKERAEKAADNGTTSIVRDIVDKVAGKDKKKPKEAAV